MTNARGPRPLLTADQVATWLGLSKKALYHAIDKGQVPTPLKIGNRLRWRAEAIESFIDDAEKAETEFRRQS